MKALTREKAQTSSHSACWSSAVDRDILVTVLKTSYGVCRILIRDVYTGGI